MTMSDASPVSEFDLLAYADGVLDDDPRRKAVVEAWLDIDPENRKRVDAFREQARLLRSIYGARFQEPVPERFREALRVPSQRGRHASAALRAAGLAVLAGSASAFGWLMAPSGRDDPWSDAFFHQGLAEPATAAAADTAGSRHLGPEDIPETPGGLFAGLAHAFPPPDLRKQGYRLVSRETLIIGRREVLRHSYIDSEGQGFQLFLRPRNDLRPTGVEVVKGSRAAFAHWRDGPVAWAIAARRPADDVRRLAEEVRHALELQRLAPAHAAISEPAPDLLNGFGPASLPDALLPAPERKHDGTDVSGQN